MIVSLAKKPEIKSNILAGDVGASKTNLAICAWNGRELTVQKNENYKTRDFQNIQLMIDNFLSGEKKPAVICLGIAGPVQDGKVTMTNLGWQINEKQVSAQFKHIPVRLINDLEATAYSLAVLDANDIHILHEGRQDSEGNIAIIAPGTGLGEAGLYHDSDGYHPFATEGGHSDFAPASEIDIEIYRSLSKKFGHVSWERVVSGPGICAIYEFLLQQKDRDEPAWLKEKLLAHDKARVITENAGECGICKEATEIFIRYLARESANLVLKLKATGGLFIAGGILPHLLPFLHKDEFLKWFSQRGRLKNLLQNIPIGIIMNETAPLLGAAYYGAQAK